MLLYGENERNRRKANMTIILYLSSIYFALQSFHFYRQAGKYKLRLNDYQYGAEIGHRQIQMLQEELADLRSQVYMGKKIS